MTPSKLLLRLTLPALAATQTGALAAENSPDTFTLGSIEVSGTSDSSSASTGFASTVITQADMNAQMSTDVGQALSHTTGLSPTVVGQRNETQLYIRGFNQNQITLNIDGIPVYVPYDGNVDLSRFLTAGYSQIVVTKGLGSLMYGPNNMGGTINLVSKRPTAPFTLDLGAGITANQRNLYGNEGKAQAGSRFDEHWYLTAGLAVDSATSFPLASSFTPVAAQPGGDRLHDATHTDNANVKLGFMPNATDEYALAINTINSIKQDAPYTGNPAQTGQRVAYWDWPLWAKQSSYFLGDTKLGAGMFKTRLYLDQFNNALSSFDTASYTTTYRPYAFKSKYMDHSGGGNVEYDLPLGAAHLAKLAAFYKNDVHTETQLQSGVLATDAPWLHFQAHTVSLGAEDTWHPLAGSEITFGLRRDHHAFDQAQVYTSTLSSSAPLDRFVVEQPRGGGNNANNWQITAQYDLGDLPIAGTATLRAGVARKTRFPGIKDVYSYSLGHSIANPFLGPEEALNRELGISGYRGGLHYDAALFWDSISSAITAVTVSPGITQNQNVATASNKGLDLDLGLPLATQVAASLRYSYLERTLGTQTLVATGTPRQRGALSLSWTPIPGTDVVAEVQANSSLQTASNGLQPVAGSSVTDLHLNFGPGSRWKLHAGVFNVFDRNYSLVEGFPQPGRMMRLEGEIHFD